MPDPNLTDATRRFLRAIKAQCDRRMFAGNHRCRQMLVDGGYIEVIERQGQWYRLAVTDKGKSVQ